MSDRAGREAAVGVQQRGPRAGARPARRAVDLAVGEDRHVALVRPGRGVAEVVVEDRPVDAGEPVVARVAGVLGAGERALDLAAERDQLARRRAGSTASPAAAAGSDA